MYATFTTHRADLARCLLGAERFKDAGDTYLQLQNFASAAKCFEKGKLWLQAAHAYNSYDELEHALRCAYECHDYDTAAAFITQYKARNPPASELIRHQTAYSRKGADYYLSKKDLKTMMQFVHAFPTTVYLCTMILHVTCMCRLYIRYYLYLFHICVYIYSTIQVLKREYLIRTNNKALILEVEIADGQYSEAAKMYEGRWEYDKASEYYEKHAVTFDTDTGRVKHSHYHEEAVRCILKRVRLSSLTQDYFSTVVTVDEVDLTHVQELAMKSATPHYSEEVGLEVSLLRSLRGDAKQSAEAEKSIVSQLVESIFALETTRGRPGSSWRMTAIALQAALSEQKDRHGCVKYLGLLTSLVDRATSVTSTIATGKPWYQLGDADKTLVRQLVDYFGLAIIDVHQNLALPTVKAVEGAFGKLTQMPLREFAQKAGPWLGSLVSHYKRGIIQALQVEVTALSETPVASKQRVQELATTSGQTSSSPLPHTEAKWELILTAHQLHADNAVAKSTTHKHSAAIDVSTMSGVIGSVYHVVAHQTATVLEDASFITLTVRPNKLAQDVIRDKLTQLLKCGRIEVLEYERLASILSLLDLSDGNWHRELRNFKKTVDLRFKDFPHVPGLAGKDTRLRLLLAYLVQINHEFAADLVKSWWQSRLLLTAKFTAEAIVDEYLKCGAIYLIFHQNDTRKDTPLSVISKEDKCLSLHSYIQIIEKAFVILLLFWKRGRDMYCFEYMLYGVLCRDCSSYADAVYDLIKGEAVYDRDSGDYRPHNDPATILSKFIDALFSVFCHLTVERLNMWVKAAPVDVPLASTLFLERMLTVILTYMANVASSAAVDGWIVKLNSLSANTNLAVLQVSEFFRSVIRGVCKKEPVIPTISRITLIHGSPLVRANCVENFDSASVQAVVDANPVAASCADVLLTVEGHCLRIETAQRVLAAHAAAEEEKRSAEAAKEVNEGASVALLSALRASAPEFKPSLTASADLVKEEYTMKLRFVIVLRVILRRARATLAALTPEEQTTRYIEKQLLLAGHHRYTEVAVAYKEALAPLLHQADQCIETLAAFPEDDRQVYYPI